MKRPLTVNQTGKLYRLLLKAGQGELESIASTIVFRLHFKLKVPLKSIFKQIEKDISNA